MGSTYLADGITGINLTQDEEVVAFLVSRNVAFPYNDRVNEAPVRPGDLYRINSLPIFGAIDEDLGLAVEADQLGVTLALQMTATADWNDFVEKAVTGKGVPFALKSRQPQSLQERQADARPRTYGLFVISRDTFNRVKRKVRFNGEKQIRSDAALRREQVSEILALYDAFFDVQRFMKGEPTAGQSAAERILEDKRKRLVGLISATSLEGATEYQNGTGETVPLPMLSRAFGEGHGGIFGRDFTALSRALGYRGVDAAADGAVVPASAAEIPNLTRFLELIWETQRLYFGMRYLSAHVAPSMAGGQRPNRIDVLEALRQTQESAFFGELAFLQRVDALPKQYKELRLQLTRAKASVGKLEEKYDEVVSKARDAARAIAPTAAGQPISEPTSELEPKVKPKATRKRRKDPGKIVEGAAEVTPPSTSVQPIEADKPVELEPVVSENEKAESKPKYTVKIEVPF